MHETSRGKVYRSAMRACPFNGVLHRALADKGILREASGQGLHTGSKQLRSQFGKAIGDIHTYIQCMYIYICRGRGSERESERERKKHTHIYMYIYICIYMYIYIDVYIYTYT